MLLSKTAAFYFIKAIQGAGAMGSVPYLWDKKARRVKFVDTARARFLWLVHNSAYSSYMVFVFFRWIQVCARTSPTNPVALGTLYIFVAYNFITAIQWSLLKNYGEHQMWLNNVIEYIEEFEKTGDNGCLGKQAECIRTIRSLVVIVFTVLLLDTLSVFGGPSLPFFISSLVPDPLALSTIQVVPFALFHIYIWIHQWFSYFFYGTIVLCYVTVVRNGLATLVYPSKSTQVGMPQPINPTPFCAQMRKLQIMQCFCNKMWATTNVLYEICCIGGSILGFYGSVRLPGSRAAHQVVAAIFLASTLLNLWTDMGDIFELACKVNESWKMERRMPYFRRFLRSLRPIRMNVGGFFYADKSIRLTILAMISQNTVSLLLSTSP